MAQSPESQASEFKKAKTPDVNATYKAEQIETMPYVTLWEGIRGEHECDFQTKIEVFKTDHKIEAIRDSLIDFLTKGKTYHDGAKARLVSVADENGRLNFIFQPVNYSDYIVTNNAMEVIPPGWNQSIRDLLEPGPNLTSLKDSKSSNHLGLSCLVLTADKKLIMQKATSNVISGAGKVKCSASGAMDWQDPFANSFEVMQAELYEELGLSHEETSTLQAIAVARELARGGKPEMFFMLKSELTSTDITARIATDPEKEVESIFTIDLAGSDQGDKLQELIADPNLFESAKAGIYYLSRTHKAG